MTTNTLGDWVDLVDNFVATFKSSSNSLLSEDQPETDFSVNDWDQNMASLWQKCSDSSTTAHLATNYKHIYLAALGLATMFKVNLYLVEKAFC